MTVAPTAGAPVLAARGLSARYGQVQALAPLDFEVGPGELVAVLGPNGAGKSTLLRAILGLVANAGTVTFLGAELPRRNPVAVASRGVVLVPEGRGIFGPMTVAENLELGACLLALGRLVAVIDPREVQSHDQLAQYYFA